MADTTNTGRSGREDLKRIYREALPERVQSLEQELAALAEGSGEAARAVRTIAHSLRGSGATYGFPEVTEAAAAVEDADATVLVERCRRLLAVLRSVAAEPRASLLIVDDDTALTRTLQAQLAGPAREIAVADSVASGRRMIAQRRFSLILLDLMLPDGDGRRLLREIREQPANANTPVIILSARTGDAAKAECLALRANAFFEKPFDPDALSSAVDERLGRAGEGEADDRADPETGLANRAAFREAFDRATAEVPAEQQLVLGIVQGVPPSADHDVRADDLKAQALLISAILEGVVCVARWSPTELAFLAAAALSEARARLDRALAPAGLPPLGDHAVPAFIAGILGVPRGMSFEEATAKAEHVVSCHDPEKEQRVLGVEDAGAPAALPVLLVEDDHLVASIIKHRLIREGLEVLHFEDGSAALAAIATTRLGAAILDVKVPGADGFEVLAGLRASAENSRVPAMMLTALGSEKDVVRGFDLGADDYVVKPFSPVEVVARLHRLLART